MAISLSELWQGKLVKAAALPAKHAEQCHVQRCFQAATAAIELQVPAGRKVLALCADHTQGAGCMRDVQLSQAERVMQHWAKLTLLQVIDLQRDITEYYS